MDANGTIKYYSRARLPQGAFAPNLYLDHAENHWQSAKGLVRYIAWMDADINHEHPGCPLLCILDAANSSIATCLCGGLCKLGA
eukprot:6057299-Amphidinium_carterae.1